MAVVKRLLEADSDLFEIWNYIAEDSIPEADELIREIDQAFQLIAENPKMGSRRDKLGERLRAFPVKSYVIYYRPLDGEEEIEVVRVLNGAQDISKLHFE